MKENINELRWCKVTPSVGKDGFDKVKFTIINHQGVEFLEHNIGLKFFRLKLNRDDGKSIEARYFYNISEMGEDIEFTFRVNEKRVTSCIKNRDKGNNIDSQVFRLCKSEDKLNRNRNVYNLIKYDTRFWK